MKNTLTVILILFSTTVFAQDSLRTFNQSRYHITTTGMTVLGSWAVANISVGAAGWAVSKGGSNKYFYQMNTLWNVVNLGAALLGYTGAQKDRDKHLSAAETLQAQKKIERIFLVNAEFDVVYIGAGLYVNHRGNSNNSDRQRGYGQAVALQGAFLLLFDATMYGTNRSNGNKLRRFLEKNPMTFNGREVGLIYHM